MEAKSSQQLENSEMFTSLNHSGRGKQPEKKDLYSIKSDTSRKQGNKNSQPKKLQTSYHIDDIVKIPLRSDWYDSTFSNDERMEKSTTFSAPFISSSLRPDTNILCPRIYFGMKTTHIDTSI